MCLQSSKILRCNWKATSYPTALNISIDLVNFRKETFFDTSEKSPVEKIGIVSSVVQDFCKVKKCWQGEKLTTIISVSLVCYKKKSKLISGYAVNGIRQLYRSLHN